MSFGAAFSAQPDSWGIFEKAGGELVAVKIIGWQGTTGVADGVDWVNFDPVFLLDGYGSTKAGDGLSQVGIIIGSQATFGGGLVKDVGGIPSGPEHATRLFDTARNALT